MKRIKLEISYLTVLFMGLISTLGGGIWLIIAENSIRERGLIGCVGYLDRGVEEIVYCALLHIIVGTVMLICEGKKQTDR